MRAPIFRLVAWFILKLSASQLFSLQAIYHVKESCFAYLESNKYDLKLMVHKRHLLN